MNNFYVFNNQKFSCSFNSARNLISVQVRNNAKNEKKVKLVSKIDK